MNKDLLIASLKRRERLAAVFWSIGKYLCIKTNNSAAGVSRSSTIVAAYLMVIQKQGLHECLSFLLKCRPCINPNEGFYKQLTKFEKDLGLASKLPKPCMPYFGFGS